MPVSPGRARRPSAVIVALWGVLAVLGAPLAYAASPAHDLGVVARPMGGVLAGTSALGAVPPAVLVSDQKVTVDPEPDGTAVALDVTIFASAAAGPHPAVLLGHGFGGSKADMADRARSLAEHGYVVLTWTARGFGASGGRIHLDDPVFEGADVKALVDVLAARSDVLKDESSDPRVGIAGGSYGGAIALIGAALDPRIDTVVAAITWNDLAASLFPQATTLPAAAAPGPIKQQWISRFFAASLGGAARGGDANGGSRSSASPSASSSAAVTSSAAASSGAPAPPGAGAGAGSAGAGGGATGGAGTGAAAAAGAGGILCGRFDPTVCRLLLTAAQSGTPSPELLALLRAHSPAALIGQIKAPTFLIQGMADSLFGLDQADATARALQAQGVPVAVRWIDGGHDGPSSTATQDDAAADTWLAHYLKAPAHNPSPASSPVPAGASSASALPVPVFVYAGTVARRASVAPLFSGAAYPGIAATAPREVTTIPFASTAGTKAVLTPPGGAPASISAVPGLGALTTGLPTYQLAALPGQSVAFDTTGVGAAVTVVGAPRVRLRVTSTGSQVTLFVSLWQVQGQNVSQPRGLVAPVRVDVTPGTPTEVEVALPAATWQFASGSRWRVLVTSTDAAYGNPREARADRIETVGGLDVPTLVGTPLAGTSERDTEALVVGAAILGVLVVILAGWLIGRRRRSRVAARPEFAEVPLVVDHLVKTYADGHRAVDDVSWRAEKGQVVGLLGPNGAGKTTTIRMMLGLITPDSGTVHVLGSPVTPGADVLGRVGALVEGPGFLPHLTGRANLEAFWRATGRPVEEAGFEEALSVAALGGALDRPVRTYSHGMRQRLGIAQSMLGLPEVLILDEPTNGLDPPQIAAMRPILHAYAAGGRTVVISSHLLAEVEQTCSHVVVMHAGRVVTTGAVADLVASSDTTVVELGPAGATPTVVASALREIDGIRSVDVEDDGAHGKMTIVADRPRASVVSEVLSAGGDVVGVGSRRQLEEVFLGVIAAAAQVDGGSGLDGGASGRGSSGGDSGTDAGDSGQSGSEGHGTGAGDAARSGAGGPGMSADTGSLIEKLRQVRAR